MNRTIIILVLCLGVGRSALESSAAEPDAGSRPPYADARLVRVEPDGVTFRHATGVAKIPFEELPPDFQTRFAYDAEAARAYQSQTRLAQQEWRVAAWAGVRRAAEDQADRLDRIRERELTRELESTLRRTSGYYRLNLIGDTGRGWLAAPAVPVTIRGGPLAHNRRGWESLDQTLVVSGLPSAARANGQWTGRLYYAGRERFTDGCGQPRSWPRYSTSPEAAAAALLSDTHW